MALGIHELGLESMRREVIIIHDDNFSRRVFPDGSRGMAIGTFKGFDKLWILLKILKKAQWFLEPFWKLLGAPGGGSVWPGPGPGLKQKLVSFSLPLYSHVWQLGQESSGGRPAGGQPAGRRLAGRRPAGASFSQVA